MKNIVEIGITIINNTEKIPFKQFLVYKIVLNHKTTLRWRLCDIKNCIEYYSKCALFSAIEWLRWLFS